jgi:hypothetical protein
MRERRVKPSEGRRDKLVVISRILENEFLPAKSGWGGKGPSNLGASPQDDEEERPRRQQGKRRQTARCMVLVLGVGGLDTAAPHPPVKSKRVRKLLKSKEAIF